MPLALHERARLGVGALGRALGESRFSMARWLRAEGVPLHGAGWRYVLASELRIHSPMIWEAVLLLDSLE